MRRSLMTRLIAGLCIGGMMTTGLLRAEDAPAADVTAAGHATQTVAASLYTQYKDRDGNLCLSPYALSLALGAVHAGARGGTQTELATALGIDALAGRATNAQGTMARAVTAAASGSAELTTTVTLWPDASAAAQADYSELATAQYGATLTPMDFAADAGAARDAINTAVGTATGGAVPEILRRGAVRDHTRLVVAGFLTFHAAWQNGFAANEIADGYFLVTPTQVAPVKMMNKTDGFAYAEVDGAQIVSIPFKDGKQTLMVVLPTDAAKLPAIEAALSAAKLQAWQDALKETTLHLTLPRFSLHTARDVAIPLEGLGIKTVFDREKADLSGIGGEAGVLSLGPVLHRAALTIDESGEVRSVSAATRLLMGDGQAAQTTRMNVDHPFIFVVRDEGTGAILLIGRLVNPGEK